MEDVFEDTVGCPILPGSNEGEERRGEERRGEERRGEERRGEKTI